MVRIELDSLNLEDAERKVVAEALRFAETLANAAERLGITHGSLRHKMRKFRLARDGSPKDGGK